MAIALVTTGGTIAMKEQEVGKGAVPTLTGADFLSRLPPGFPEIVVEEHCNLPSSHFTLEILWGLRERVMNLAASPDIEGIVITHGTDTMEETAYLLDITIPTEKPIVLTGAMRTVGEPGYEGFANLVAALRTAASEEASGRGVMVVMNEEIHAARYVTKGHTLSTATFISPGWGPMGRVDGDRVVFAWRPSHKTIPCNGLEEKVCLIKLGVGMGDEILRFALEQGARGVVLEGMGAGRVPHWWMPAIREAVGQGVAVVIASRCPAGRIYDPYGYPGAYRDLRKAGVLFAEGLNGQKARIRLMVVLGMNPKGEELKELWYNGLR
ncbi:MAG: asparaginase [Chloroflexi bacterium]|nr:MAG: asparaginase [Chloroflexota bacterium]HDN79772.1 asparaginase [Chloroflexota bacterium]